MALEQRIGFLPEDAVVNDRRIRATISPPFVELARTAALAVQYGDYTPDGREQNQLERRDTVGRAGRYVARLAASLTTFVEYPEVTERVVEEGGVQIVTHELAVPSHARDTYARTLAVNPRLIHGISVSYVVNPDINEVGYVQMSTGPLHDEAVRGGSRGSSAFLNVAADYDVVDGSKALSAASGIVRPNGIVDFVEQDCFADVSLWARALDIPPGPVAS